MTAAGQPNRSRARENRSSLFAVLATMVGAGALIAVLFGLGTKPEVSEITMIPFGSAGSAVPADGVLPSPQATVPTDTADPSAAPAATAPVSTDSAAAPAPTETVSAAATPTEPPVATLVPASPATATPVLTDAAASDVAPADGTAGTAAAADSNEPVQADTEAGAEVPSPVDGVTATDASAAITGIESYTGAFFTRPEEDAGALVTVNTVVITIGADGTGSFDGALEMTLSDATTISLDMSGPFTWTSASPQAVGAPTGTYDRLDADGFDIGSATTGELTITDIATGSGSICLPKCHGFTFAPG